MRTIGRHRSRSQDQRQRHFSIGVDRAEGLAGTVRTRSGQDVTGIVRDVNANVVQIGGVTGKEFFDAVVPLSAVDAVYVRVKE